MGSVVSQNAVEKMIYVAFCNDLFPEMMLGHVCFPLLTHWHGTLSQSAVAITHIVLNGTDWRDQ